MSLLKAERRNEIAKVVTRKGAARVAELSARFDVHPATIRRDLERLEDEGMIRRVHGGAVSADRGASEPKEAVSAPQEDWVERVGEAVAGRISDDETVFLGPGKLTLAVASSLTAANLTILTNSLQIAHWVASHTDHLLIVTGGQAEKQSQTLVGQLARDALSNLRADYTVLDVGGVSAVDGLTVASLQQADLVREVLDLGAQIIVLTSVERVGRVAAAYVAPITAVDVLVAPRETPSASLWDLSEAGVQIVLV